MTSSVVESSSWQECMVLMVLMMIMVCDGQRSTSADFGYRTVQYHGKFLLTACDNAEVSDIYALIKDYVHSSYVQRRRV